MGKGDKKTAKGKRAKASYGNARSHTETTKKPSSVKKVAPTPKAPVVKKAAPAKKKA
jgi:30S ribosomal protein S31